jgi:hypothetical protein
MRGPINVFTHRRFAGLAGAFSQDRSPCRFTRTSGEHWVIAVGYDDRGTPETADDVILFADSADVCDDYQDGYTFANADKFYWCWFDVWYYGKLKWRPMITVLGRE